MYISNVKKSIKNQSWRCLVLLRLVQESFDCGKTSVSYPSLRGWRAVLLVPAAFLCHFCRRCPNLAATPPPFNMQRNIKFNRSCPCFEDTLDLKPLAV